MNRYVQLFSVFIEHGYYLNFGAVPHPALDAERRDALTNQFAIKSLFNIVENPLKLASSTIICDF